MRYHHPSVRLGTFDDRPAKTDERLSVMARGRGGIRTGPGDDRVAILSDYARRKKVDYFLKGIPKHSRILEVGCGDGWVRDYLKRDGWSNYVGLDRRPPAEIVGDIKDWRELGIEAASFDVVIAFEVVEHEDCFKACYEILRPGGKMMVTSPLPHMDWVMRVLESLGLNQKRTSPHDHLVYLRDAPCFEHKEIKVVGFLSQWGVLQKEGGEGN